MEETEKQKWSLEYRNAPWKRERGKYSVLEEKVRNSSGNKKQSSKSKEAEIASSKSTENKQENRSVKLGKEFPY